LIKGRPVSIIEAIKENWEILKLNITSKYGKKGSKQARYSIHPNKLGKQIHNRRFQIKRGGKCKQRVFYF